MAEGSLDPFIKSAREEQALARARQHAYAKEDHQRRRREEREKAEAANNVLAGSLPEVVLGAIEAQYCRDFLARMSSKRFRGADLIFPDSLVRSQADYPSLATRALLLVASGQRHPSIPDHWRAYEIGDAYDPERPLPQSRQRLGNSPTDPRRSSPDIGVFLCEDGRIRGKKGLALPDGHRVETGDYEYERSSWGVYDSGGSSGPTEIATHYFAWRPAPITEILSKIVVENGAG